MMGRGSCKGSEDNFVKSLSCLYVSSKDQTQSCLTSPFFFFFFCFFLKNSVSRRTLFVDQAVLELIKICLSLSPEH